MRGGPGLTARMTAVVALVVTGCATAGWTSAGPRAHSLAAAPAASVAADSLWGVVATGQSDAWAVGTRYLSSHIGVFLTLTEHWDGHRWKVVPSPSPEGIGEQTASILGAVAAASPHDVWAVGSRSPASTDHRKIVPSYGLIEHWNGAKWTVVPGPKSGAHTTGLTAVAAISRTAAWAIGEGTARGHAITVFMRWNGTRWRYLPSPAGTSITGLAVTSAHDIWVVGTKQVAKSATKYRTLAEHWNGSKWTVVPTPQAFKGRTRNSNLYAAGGSSGNSVWAVGWYQSGPAGIDHSTLTEHWNGKRWLVRPSPDGPSQLFAVTAPSRGKAWAVGAYGSGSLSPLADHWNGVRWTATPSKLQAGIGFASLYGVTAESPRAAWAVGSARNQDNRSVTLIERWNGSRWQQVPSPNP